MVTNKVKKDDKASYVEVCEYAECNYKTLRTTQLNTSCKDFTKQ